MKNKITQITMGLDSDSIICISIVRTKPNGDTFGRLYYPELDTLEFVEKTFNTMLENDKIKVTHVSTITWKFGLAVTYVPVEPQEFFEIMSVSREDLDRLGFDTSKVEDSTMRRLASKVGDSLNSDAGAFYYAVEYNGEMLEIPRPNPRDYDDENEGFETRRREPDWSIGDDDDVEFDPIS